MSTVLESGATQLKTQFCETNSIPKTYPRSSHRAPAKKRNFQTNLPTNKSFIVKALARLIDRETGLTDVPLA